jgi:hypothetical protein
MRRLFIVVSLLLMSLPWLPAQAQFAGCADEVGQQFGARYLLNDLGGEEMIVAAIGIGDFDPELTILNPAGEPIACDTDSDEAQDYSAGLPSVRAPANSRTAVTRFEIPDRANQDIEIIVTSADNRSGEFVLVVSGLEIFGADDSDLVTIFSNEGQVEVEAPLGMYAVNLDRPEQLLDPVLRFSYSNIFERICYKSSAASLCQGNHSDMAGFEATVAGNNGIMTGDDVMAFVELGGQTAEFELEITSYQAATFGPYTLLIHSGVGYP